MKTETSDPHTLSATAEDVPDRPRVTISAGDKVACVTVSVTPEQAATFAALIARRACEAMGLGTVLDTEGEHGWPTPEDKAEFELWDRACIGDGIEAETAEELSDPENGALELLGYPPGKERPSLPEAIRVVIVERDSAAQATDELEKQLAAANALAERLAKALLRYHQHYGDCGEDLPGPCGTCMACEAVAALAEAPKALPCVQCEQLADALRETSDVLATVAYDAKTSVRSHDPKPQMFATIAAKCKAAADTLERVMAKPGAPASALSAGGGEASDFRPRCCRCGKRWLPAAGQDARVVPCPLCRIDDVPEPPREKASDGNDSTARGAQDCSPPEEGP
jgi:hypothetical protein